MMCAPAVPGDISQGALSLGLVDRPVVSGVAIVTFTTSATGGGGGGGGGGRGGHGEGGD